MKKKKSKPEHVTYNQKNFLAPKSINSMAAIHCKIKKEGTAIVRISDCNHSIRIWNDFNEHKAKEEMIEKIDMLLLELRDFKCEIQSRL